MSNKVYDILKAIALTLPLIITFITAIMKIWNIPYAEKISATIIVIIGVFGAYLTGDKVVAIVKIANDIYCKNQVQTNVNTDTQDELIEEGVVENED